MISQMIIGKIAEVLYLPKKDKNFINITLDVNVNTFKMYDIDKNLFKN